jgi:hypothetical protein
MCRYYTRRFHNEHTLIIQKKTALINDYIDALITDVEDDPRDKFIFITNVEGTTPDATCFFLNFTDPIELYMTERIRWIKGMIENNLHCKFVKIDFDNDSAVEWVVELSDADVGDMLKETCDYFIEIENSGTLTVERFRKELLDTYPVLRHKYDPKIDYQEQVDYVNEENEMLRKDAEGTVLPTPTDSD